MINADLAVMTALLVFSIQHDLADWHLMQVKSVLILANSHWDDDVANVHETRRS
jgi:hypothetical protein